MSLIDLAVVHYPVYGPDREITATATSSLDVHDLARVARTYGLGRYYVVTPLERQQAFVRELCAHWISGSGLGRNPTRAEALKLVSVADDLDGAVADAAARHGSPPLLAGTTARRRPGAADWTEAAERLTGRPVMLLFGTGWGLADSLLARVDLILPPLAPESDFNHLSVRSAAAIIVDRLLGKDRPVRPAEEAQGAGGR